MSMLPLDLFSTYTNNIVHPEAQVKSVVNTRSPLNDPSVLQNIRSTRIFRFNIDTNKSGQRLRSHPENVPYGKKVVNETLIDHPEEQKPIGLISSPKSAGASNRAIAVLLNERGIPTKKRSFKGWHHEMIRQILAQNIISQ